jgi:nitrogen fixation protein NifZ
MFEPRLPKYQWGRRVKAAVDLFNDGGYPDVEPEALLVACGGEGEIVQVGAHTDTSTPLYLVEFTNGRVVGCLEEEIEPIEIP